MEFYLLLASLLFAQGGTQPNCAPCECNAAVDWAYCASRGLRDITELSNTVRMQLKTLSVQRNAITHISFGRLLRLYPSLELVRFDEQQGVRCVMVSGRLPTSPKTFG